MSFKHNQTFTVKDQSPISDHDSTTICDKASNDHTPNRLSGLRSNNTFTINTGDLIRSQSFNNSCDDEFLTCPSQNMEDSCRESGSKSPDRTVNLNKAFISLSEGENSQPCEQRDVCAANACEVVHSESHQLLSTYTIGSSESRELLSTFTIDSQAYTYTIDSQAYTYAMDPTGNEIFNCLNCQASQSEQEEETYFPSNQLPCSNTTKVSNCHCKNRVPPASPKSCSDQLSQTNFFRACLEGKNSESCLNKIQTKKQYCGHSNKSPICCDSNNHDFQCANSVGKKVMSETFLVEKNVENESQSPNRVRKLFRDKSDLDSSSNPVIAASNDGEHSQDVHDKQCSDSRYDAISARLMELFVPGTSTNKQSHSASAPSSSSGDAVNSKPVSPKPGDECDKSSEYPKSSSTDFSEKSPFSNDIFGSAELKAELENVANKKNKFSPGLTQDSLFVISQGKAYDHFKAKLESNGNVKISTQSNFQGQESSSETCFSLSDNSGDKKMAHSAFVNELPAEVDAPSFSDASLPKSALLLREQKLNSSNRTSPTSKGELLIADVPESCTSEVRPQPTFKAADLSVISAHSAKIASSFNKQTSLPTPKSLKSNAHGFMSPSASFCTVVEVEPESVKKQNKQKIKETSKVACSENEIEASLNQAYIAEESKGEKRDLSVSPKRLSPQNNEQSCEKFRKKKKISQNSQRSSSVTTSSGEISKPSNQTSWSSKTRNSSTNTSSCIVESSIVHSTKIVSVPSRYKNFMFRRKKRRKISSFKRKKQRSEQAKNSSFLRRKRMQLCRRRKIVSLKRKKQQSKQIKNTSLSTVYSSLNSNSGRANEISEVIDLTVESKQKSSRRKKKRRPKKSLLNGNGKEATKISEAKTVKERLESIDLKAGPEEKLSWRKRRKLFIKLKILQRRRNQKQAEENLRLKIKSEGFLSKSQNEPSHVTNKTSNSSSGASVIDTSIPDNPVLMNNCAIKKRLVGDETSLSQKKPTTSEASKSDDLSLRNNHTTEEKSVSNETAFTPKSSKSNYLSSRNNNNNNNIEEESSGKETVLNQRQLTPESYKSNDLSSRNKHTTEEKSVSNETVFTPKSSKSNDLSLRNNNKIESDSVGKKTVLNLRQLTPESSKLNDLSSRNNHTIEEESIGKETVLNKRKLTPETSEPNDLSVRNNHTVEEEPAGNKTVLNQRKLTPVTSKSNILPLRNNRTMEEEPVSNEIVFTPESSKSNDLSLRKNRTIRKEPAGNKVILNQIKLTPVSSKSNDLSLSNNRTIKEEPVGNKTVLNQRKATCQTSKLNNLPEKPVGSKTNSNPRKLTPETSKRNSLPSRINRSLQEETVTDSNKTMSRRSLPSSLNQIKCSVESTTKQQIVRLCNLKYFCVHVSAINQEFLANNGLLPKLCLQQLALPIKSNKRKKRKLETSECFILLEDCMKKKTQTPPAQTRSFSRSPKRRKISSPPSETLSFFSNPKRNISLSSSKKDSSMGSGSQSLDKKPAENPDKASCDSVPDQIPCCSKDEMKNNDLIEDDKAFSSSDAEKNFVRLTQQTGLASGPFESSLSVKACLMQINPRISENIVSAVCFHCTNVMPYALAKKEFLGCASMWPNNMAPLCPSSQCNKRKLHWGIFKMKLVLKTQKGEYHIAQLTTPDAEKFLGCTISEFFEDAEHERRIKQRIDQLLVSQKKKKDIIFKNYNLVVNKTEDTLRLRIVNTSLFDP